MVRALLNGTKTQTRRIIKDPPPKETEEVSPYYHPSNRTHHYAYGQVENGSYMILDWDKACPYGDVGDRLYVRETWSTHACFDEISPAALTTRSIHYWADGAITTGKGRPSIHMPRWASRILLEIVSVRVERLQDISESDAEAEGIDFMRQIPDADETLTAVELYEILWEAINGPGSWAANPWVWVVGCPPVQEPA